MNITVLRRFAIIAIIAKVAFNLRELKYDLVYLSRMPAHNET